jgi:putative nucleotidyltransferase with HDIG domain
MEFAVGADAALERLADHRYDVVVSDLVMAGMDGVALLREVERLQPSAVRIIMSGSVETDVAARAATVAHRLLAKPCDADELGRVLERSYELNALAEHETLRRTAMAAISLPAVPQVYLRLVAVLEDPEATTQDAARVVEQDPALAAKLLQLANSGFFARSQTISRLDQAVGLVGFRTLATLALSAGVFTAFRPTRPIEHFSVEVLQRHSTLVARIARRLLPAGHLQDEAAAAGLLHDIGFLILADQEPDYLAALLELAHDERRLVPDVEYEQRGISHAEVGAHLLALWGVPHSIVEAVAYHHRPDAAPEPALDAIAAVAIAEALAHQHDTGPIRAGGWVAPEVDADYLARLDATEHVARWHELASTEADRS